MHTSKNILIIGASGLLGSKIAKYYINAGSKVIATFQKHNIYLEDSNLTPLKLNIIDDESIEGVLKLYKPDAIIHCAGLTNVDVCEVNEELAYKVNAYSVRILSQYAQKNKSKFVYISTDHLFDGKQPFATEKSTPYPLNIYARSKLLGEEISMQEYPASLIVRTNFFGKGMDWRQSFTDWLWFQLRSGKRLNLFQDSYFSPIAISYLIECIDQLMQKNATSIFNVCGAERISKFDFGIKFCRYFHLDQSKVSATFLQNSTLKAVRPHDMSLSTKKLCDFLNIETPDVMKSFSSIKGDYAIES